MEGNSNQSSKDNLSWGMLIKGVFVQLDWGLSRILAKSIQFLLMAIIAIVSFLLVRKGLIGISEYGEGLAELSNAEIGFIVLAVILVCRLLIYSSITSVSSWRTYATPFFWFGIFVLLGWSMMSLILLSEIQGAKEKLELYLQTQEHHLQLILMVTFLFSLYISVPSQKLIIDDEVNNEEVEGSANVAKMQNTSESQSKQNTESKDTNEHTAKEEVNETAKNSAV
ncbi:hypothetical protein [Parashewanella tropica]|uniref:hypothetical protein n=1 Tax=Parashewanella tropica TaxID=2547970 RepID=UPI00105A53F7|nr:hypothetical protein [Parashewanella tropica]